MGNYQSNQRTRIKNTLVASSQCTFDLPQAGDVAGRGLTHLYY